MGVQGLLGKHRLIISFQVSGLRRVEGASAPQAGFRCQARDDRVQRTGDRGQNYLDSNLTKFLIPFFSIKPSPKSATGWADT